MVKQRLTSKKLDLNLVYQRCLNVKGNRNKVKVCTSMPWYGGSPKIWVRGKHGCKMPKSKTKMKDITSKTLTLLV